MTRSVADAAVLLAAIAGPIRATAPRRGHAARLRARARPQAAAGRPPRRRRSQFGRHPAVDAIAEAAVAKLTAAGAVLIDPVELDFGEGAGEAELEVLLYELRAGLPAWLADSLPTPHLHPRELITWNERHAAAEMPWFAQEFSSRRRAAAGSTTRLPRGARQLPPLSREEASTGSSPNTTSMRSSHRPAGPRG